MFKRSSILALMISFALSVPASAQMFIEPSIGVRILTSDAADILGPGIMIGGNVGYQAMPMFAVVAHADFSFHGASVDADDVFDSGAVLNLTLGGRLTPFGSNTESPIQPYIGAEIGRSALGFQYTDFAQSFGLPETDAAGAWVGGVNAGMKLKLSTMLGLSVGGRFLLESWDSETNEGFDMGDFSGSQFDVHGILSLNF